MIAASVVLAVLLTQIESEPTHVSGRLCIAPANAHSDSRTCHDTRGEAAHVEAAGMARTYTWITADGAMISVGILPKDQTLVSLGDSQKVIPLRIVDRHETDQLESLALAIQSAENQWNVSLSSRQIAALRSLAVPDEVVVLTAQAPHRAPASVRIPKGRVHTVYNLVLQPLPVLAGRVIDKRTRNGIAGTIITQLPSETVSAVTDYRGQFRFEIEGEWPSHLKAESPSYGMKRVSTPKAQTTTVLPWIEMSPPGALLLKLTQPREMDVEVWHVEAGDRGTRVASRRTSQTESEVRLAGLDAGDYHLVLKGPGPFAQHVAPIVITESADTVHEIDIQPASLRLNVTAGAKPRSGARLELFHDDPKWRTAATTNEYGDVTGELWQQGEFVAFISEAGAGGTHIARKTLSGPEIEWRIDLSGATISGTVIDGSEKFPVPDALVVLDTKLPDEATNVRTRTNDAGQFTFQFVPAGEQTLTISAMGYSNSEQRFSLPEGMNPRAITVELAPALSATVRVRNSYGAPLVSATIADGVGGMHNDRTTDADGRTTVLLRRGEARAFFVLPREGSFAVHQIVRSGKDDEPEEQIIVPKGDTFIDIRTQDTTGAPIPNVFLAIRYNGVFIPHTISSLMGRLHGNMLRTSPSGAARLQNLPAGSYELWPIFSSAQLTDAQAGRIPPAATLVALPGENSVILTFEKPSSP